MRKPRVITNCVANSFTGDNERIIEFSDAATEAPDSGVTGGLIAFRRTDDGRLTISVYALSGPIDVVVGDNAPVYVKGKQVAG